jgi:hypothetical protein
MKIIINNIFNNVKYWQNKNLLLQAIDEHYFTNMNVILQLLGITSINVSEENKAKRDMWNYQIKHYGLGDDILRKVHPKILENFNFAKQAIEKYNRTYIFLSKPLKASRPLAKTAVLMEREDYQDKNNFNLPILAYMPDIFKIDNELALMATTRNINNFKYATNLKKNKYFILEMMNVINDDSTKEVILENIDKTLFYDKKFLAKLGCFDKLSDEFKQDIEYISNSVKNDISILKKTEIFDEKILLSALDNNNFVLPEIFQYIEKFNSDYEELDSKIKNKDILKNLFWQFGETIAEEF